MDLGNPYKVLGVETDADLDICKKSWRKLCIKYHPDNGGSPDTFDNINKAWEQVNTLKKSGIKLNIITRSKLSHETLFKIKIV